MTSDALLIGIGEWYGVLVTLPDGVFEFVAEAADTRQRFSALVRTGTCRSPTAKSLVTDNTRMWHPMLVHGHTYLHAASGARTTCIATRSARWLCSPSPLHSGLSRRVASLAP